MKLCLTDHSALFVLPCLKHTQRRITKQRQTNVAKAFFNEITELDLCSVVTTQGKQNEACKTNCDIVYGSSLIFPPAFFSVTWRNTMADALAACFCFVKIYSQWCVFRQKKKKRPDSSLKLSSPALRNDKGESWSSPSLYAFSSVSLMCLSGAVEEQNSKSIKQLVYPSPWLSPGKIYWLQQQPEHTGTSSFLRGWLDIESHTGPWAWYYHRAQECHLERHGGLFPLPHFMSEGADLFQRLTTNPPALEAVLWNGSSFLINSDLLIFTETSLRFYSIFLLSF